MTDLISIVGFEGTERMSSEFLLVRVQGSGGYLKFHYISYKTMTLVNPEPQLKSTPDGGRSRPEESNKVCEEDSDLKILISNRFYLKYFSWD